MSSRHTIGKWKRDNRGLGGVYHVLTGTAMWREDDDSPDRQVQFKAEVEETADGARRTMYRGRVRVEVGDEVIEVPLPPDAYGEMLQNVKAVIGDAISDGFVGRE